MAIRCFKVRPCVLRCLDHRPPGARGAADAAPARPARHRRDRICERRNRCPAWASAIYQLRYMLLLISMLRHLGRRRRDNPHSALILLCRGGARARPCDYLTPAVPSGIADTPCPVTTRADGDAPVCPESEGMRHWPAAGDVSHPVLAGPCGVSQGTAVLRCRVRRCARRPGAWLRRPSNHSRPPSRRRDAAGWTLGVRGRVTAAVLDSGVDLIEKTHP